MAVPTSHGDGDSPLSLRLNNALFISMSAQQMFWLPNGAWNTERAESVSARRAEG